MRVETAKEADKAAGFDEEYDDEDVVQEDGVANEDEPDFICQRKTPQAQNELAKAQQDVLDLHLRIGHTLGQVTDANETEAAVKFHTLGAIHTAAARCPERGVPACVRAGTEVPRGTACEKTFKKNYQFLADDMTKLNEGLEKRAQIRTLKRTQEALSARIANASETSPEVGVWKQELANLEQRIKAMYLEMAALDQCIYVEGHGFFFAQFWLAPDLKALKGMLGIPQSGRAPHPCPHCNCKRDEIGDLLKTWDAVGTLRFLPPATILALLDIGKRGAPRLASVRASSEVPRTAASAPCGSERTPARTYAAHGITHPTEWITGGEGECPAIYTNQATERSNSVDRRAVIRKTMKGKALTGPLAKIVEPVTGRVTWAPAILELLAWGTRMMSYRLHDLHRGKQLEWWHIDIRELNLLIYAYDIDASTVWTEELLLKKLGLPAGKRIYITGRGDLKEDIDNPDCFKGVHIQVTKASKAAINKMEEKQGLLEANVKVGKKRQHLRDQDTVTGEQERKKSRHTTTVTQTLGKEGNPTFATITPLITPLR
ncbi:hypothetical protein CYMTET_25057 [Cymbomonas tetramitiformis]|uniref:Uncharacterized protein n=1 Tax=Cymbomonas tetramitiformis TaxID=36881 RepID=A0AAE0FR35_9CHLO|nr:hypothetical protein CYMTET_26930 [Cymbomonas tetramitiformis]KAK3266312.1 hypothetical protein CYMTET_25057 [Cymbomonas tetramitiformis]